MRNDELPALRRYFGLTQPELADYLGLSRTLLAHIEGGRRSIPLTAMQRLVQLLRLLPPPYGRGPADAPLPPSPAEWPTDVVDTVRRRVAAARHAAGNLAYRLGELREQVQPLRQRHALPARLAALPPDPVAPADAWPAPPRPVPPTWPALLMLGANVTLPTCGHLAQGLLEARRIGLAAEAAHLEALLATLPPPPAPPAPAAAP